MVQKEIHDLMIYQNRYFEILTEFFVKVTGLLPKDFSSLDGFSESVHRMGQTLASNHQKLAKMQASYSDLEDNLIKLYKEEAINAFSSAKKNRCL